jgi:hypothetical protein
LAIGIINFVKAARFVVSKPTPNIDFYEYNVEDKYNEIISGPTCGGIHFAQNI